MVGTLALVGGAGEVELPVASGLAVDETTLPVEPAVTAIVALAEWAAPEVFDIVGSRNGWGVAEGLNTEAEAIV